MRNIPIVLVAIISLVGSSLLPFQANAGGNAAPIITSTPLTTSVVAGTTITYQVMTTDAESDPITFGLLSTSEKMTIQASTGLFTWKPTRAGVQQITILAVDSHGNKATQSLSFSVVHGNATRLTVSPLATAITAGKTATWKATATDAFNNTWDVSSATHPSIAATAGGSWHGLTYTSEKAGSYTATFAYQTLKATASVFVAQSTPSTLEVTPPSAKTTAGEQEKYSSTFTDNHGNSWDATGVTTFTTNEPDNNFSDTATYPTKKAGTWGITAKADDLAASASISVAPGAPTFLILSPETNLLTLPINKSQQLSGIIGDQFGNQIASAVITWSIDIPIGTISTAGVFAATKTGTATILAKSGRLTAKIPVEVLASAAQTPITKKTGVVQGETIESNQSQEIAKTPAVAATTNENTAAEACTAPATWIPFALYAIYAIILALYYLLTRKEQDASWWIFPVRLTIIGVIIWSKYLCRDSLQWWPWTLVFIGLAVTAGLKRNLFSQPEATPPKQPPLF
jgi:hypothetical protein